MLDQPFAVFQGIRRGRRAVCLAAAGAALVAAAPAQASFPGRNGVFAVPPVCCEDDTSVFHTVDATGFSGLVQTDPVTFPSQIAWSADGTRVAFDGPATSLGTGHALYVQNADGTGLRQVGRGDLLRYNPAWSPDGTKLVFVQDNGAAGSGDVYTITTSGGSLTRLTTSSGWDGEPDWSPDGTRIAYHCMESSRDHICQTTPAGGSRTITTAGLKLTNVHNPSWSPDGTSIAFGANDAGGHRAIYRMSRTGGSLRLLRPGTDVNVGSHGPAWSPDGTKIAFELHTGGGTFGIFTIDAVDGSGETGIAGTEDEMRFDPSGWQPLG
jgi:Tol biopolymer transport system component